MAGLCAALSSNAQVCDFDQNTWGYQISPSSTGLAQLRSDSPYSPSSNTYGFTSSTALVASGGRVEVEMDPISTHQSSESYLSFKLGANAESGAGRGMDAGTDYVLVQYKTSQSSSYTDLVKIKGYNNALWGINDAHSQVPISGANYEEVSPFDGGYLPYGAPGAFRISDLPDDTSLILRFVLYSDRTNETWSLDEIRYIQPVHWTNQVGDRDGQNALNWSTLAVPDVNASLYVNDTLVQQPPLDTVEVASLITSSLDTLRLAGWKIRAGQWIHQSGYAVADTHVVLSPEIGLAELTINGGEVLGEITLQYIPHSAAGWRNMAIPLRTTWGDVLEDVSTSILGTNGSIYGWDAGNANWFSMGSNSYTSEEPMTLYGGPGWMDSTDLITVKGRLRSPSDTMYLQYGVPGPNSPFTTATGNEGWNLVFNPFPYPIELDALFSDLDFPSDVSPTAYLWSTKDQQYRSYNSITGAVGGATPIVTPWQSFWLQLNSSPAGGMLPLYLKSDFQASPGGDQLRKTQLSSSSVMIAHSSGSIELKIVDVPGADLKFNPELDHKQKNQGRLEAFLWSGGAVPMRLTLKALDGSHPGGIPMDLSCDTLTFVSIYLGDLSSSWWLEDLSTGHWFDLRNAPAKLEVSPKDSGRFLLWREPYLSRDEEILEPSCNVPVLSEEGFVNESGLIWDLYDDRGFLMVTLNPGDRFSLKGLQGLFIWRSDKCYQKLFIDSSNP